MITRSETPINRSPVLPRSRLPPTGPEELRGNVRRLRCKASYVKRYIRYRCGAYPTVRALQERRPAERDGVCVMSGTTGFRQGIFLC